MECAILARLEMSDSKSPSYTVYYSKQTKTKLFGGDSSNACVYALVLFKAFFFLFSSSRFSAAYDRITETSRAALRFFFTQLFCYCFRSCSCKTSVGKKESYKTCQKHCSGFATLN